MTAKRTPKIAPEFTRTREFIDRYTHTQTPEDLDIITLWAMGTWTFSPASPAMPATYPYLYLTGGKGSGKTQMGVHVLKWVCRQHEAIVNVTGAALFRMMGDYEKETGEVIPHYPTLAIDEVDAVYSSGGSNDESLRGVGNSGYTRGATVPRSMGTTTIRFPVFCPKLWMGIDNGRLPDTLTDRCIRIDFRKATPEQMSGLAEGPYSYDVEEESADLQQALADWAKREAMVLRDYRPERIPGIEPRQWEVSRALIQLARACGIEDRIAAALVSIFSRRATRPDNKVALYAAIVQLFAERDTDRLTTRDILAHVLADPNVTVPGDSGKGLSKMLDADGIAPKPIRVGKDHPDYVEGAANVHRGYFRHGFEEVYVTLLNDDDTE